ncbi:MAG: hypothetical protein QM305_09455 [Bacteroidota bacterium]|nr:hypothetical protein [Bacteroidota bacterium]
MLDNKTIRNDYKTILVVDLILLIPFIPWANGVSPTPPFPVSVFDHLPATCNLSLGLMCPSPLMA